MACAIDCLTVLCTVFARLYIVGNGPEGDLIVGQYDVSTCTFCSEMVLPVALFNGNTGATTLSTIPVTINQNTVVVPICPPVGFVGSLEVEIGCLSDFYCAYNGTNDFSCYRLAANHLIFSPFKTLHHVNI